MTQVISRTFETENLAQGVAKRLRNEGLPHSAVRIVTIKPGESSKDLTARLTGYNVAANAAKAYAGLLKGGKSATVIVNATHRPLGAAKLTRQILDSNYPVDAGKVTEESHVPDAPGGGMLSVLDSHPHFFTTPVHKRRPTHGLMSHGLGPQLVSDRKPRKSAIRGGRHMSRYFWPMKLVSTRQRGRSASSSFSLSRLFRLPTLMARR